MITTELSRPMRLLACGWLAACAMMAGAQSVAPRISEITNAEQSTLKGSLDPLAQAQFDSGRVPADTRLNGVSIVFNRTPAQQADLDALIAAQQNPTSPLFHQWLTPDAFAARFGVAQSDLDKVQSWLQQQGFSIDSVARSKNIIRFSGTVSQIEQAFSTQMHYYTVNGVRHFAPSTALSVPAAIAPTVLGIRNLDDLRPRSHAVYSHSGHLTPAFTSGQSGNVFFAPGDIQTAYDMKPVYSGGYTGAGQSIAVVGQSAVVMSDIENFQNAAGLTIKDPTQVLMPGTGTSATFGGDESESDLDLEWSGAIAPGASIYFVYTGSNTNYGAFDSIQYAVDEDLATIISSSYGVCEAELGSATLESTFQQAASQGQTIMSASGDQGSTDCFLGNNVTNPTLAQQEALAVDYPSSSAYVTGIGGTEISSTAAGGNYLVSGGGYWEASNNGSDIISSALKYIPEVAWNDDAPGCGTSDCLSSGGGGASSLFTKPAWQTGVPGIPTDGKRDVPDLAFYASPNYPGYLLCTSDSSSGGPWISGQQASCNSGFRDSSTQDLTIAGGTSFDAPIFAGMVALINQKAGYTSGQGLINPMLYTLAANSATYASAFHDITTGNNDCTAGSSFCSGAVGFSAGAGYDQVTGLGSVDFANLVAAWPSNTATALAATTTTIAASNPSPAVNVADNFAIAVTSNAGASVPTGTVVLTIDGGPSLGGPANVTETLTANGTVTYSTSFAVAGPHQIIAQYSGDGANAVSTGVVSISIATVSSGTGSFKLAATGVTVPTGSQANSTITLTPASGYTGTVDLTVTTSDPGALQSLCFLFPTTASNGDGEVIVNGAAPVTTQMTVDANAADCSGTGTGTGGSPTGGMKRYHPLNKANTSKNTGTNQAPLAVAFAGLLLAGFLGRSSRKFRSLAGLIALLAVGLGLSACGGIYNNGMTNPPAGTYTVTVTGQDSATATITGTTKFTLVIQ